MSVTATGAALLLLGLWFFVARPNRLMPAIVFLASFSGTSVLNFSNFGISPAVLFLALYLFRKTLSGELVRPVTVGRSHPPLVLCICAFAAFVLGTLLINGARQGLLSLQVTQLVYLLVGVILVATLSFEMSRDGCLEAAVKALRAAACFIAAWGVFQAACFYGGIAYPAFLFNNSTSHFADMFDQRAGEAVIRIASVAVEPSYMASSLMIFGAFGATLVVCEKRLRTAGWTVPVILVLAVVAASTSTTGFFAMAVLGLLLALRKPGIVLLSALGILLTAALALVLLPAFRAALYGVTLGKADSVSFAGRTASLGDAIARFTADPWIGAGWGTDFSYSLATSLPANVGLIGSALFIAALGGTMLTSFSARHQIRDPGLWRLRSYAMAAENAMIVYMAQAVVSGFKYVIPDFWCLWALCLAIPSNLALAALRSRQTTDPSTGTAGKRAAGRGPSAGKAWAGKDWAGKDWAGKDWAGKDWAGKDWAVKDWPI